MMRSRHLVGLVGLALAAAAATGNPTLAASSIPPYQHIFVIVEENHSFSEIIGNPAAPTINQLAQTYSLATSYFGVIHPSEGNYVGMIGGNSYGIKDDAPYTDHTITNASLIDQLEAAGLTWKGYFQSMPYAGFLGTCFPTDCTGPLYASKHDPFLNFSHVQNSVTEQLNLVPDTEFAKDIQSGQVPNFSFIVPDQCHDMHGAPPFCPDATNTSNNTVLIGQADTYLSQTVNEILSSRVWTNGNSAIVIIWDESSSGNQGCCDAKPGGGHVPAIVVTNQGQRALQDSTSYNHYSLMQTIEAAFGLGCEQFTCDTANVTPMAPLFAISNQ